MDNGGGAVVTKPAVIVTVDGPAGAGKSTVSRRLAERLGYRYLDTGAMYRAVAYAALQQHLGGEAQALAELSRRVAIQFAGERVFIDGEDVTDAIRRPDVTSVIHWAADNPEVREEMVRMQRKLAEGGNIVCDGRDQGTVVFPDAQCKIFLTASPKERARRRVADLHARGATASLEQVMADQELRDGRDQTRTVGPLRKADDAIEVMTDGLSAEQVIEKLVDIVRRCAAKELSTG